MEQHMARTGIRQLRRELLLDEIDQIVAEATETNTVLKAGSEAETLTKMYPGSGLSLPDIARAIVRTAAEAKVPVEIGEVEQSRPARHQVAPDALP
jgi:hypothetical protein